MLAGSLRARIDTPAGQRVRGEGHERKKTNDERLVVTAVSGLEEWQRWHRTERIDGATRG